MACHNSVCRDAVPYEDIDPEIRGLVRLINTMPGLRSQFSCAGHAEGDEAYVAFFADTPGAVAGLLSRLPFMGWRCGFAHNRPISKIIWMTVSRTDAGELRYELRLGGTPTYARQELLGEVESALR